MSTQRLPHADTASKRASAKKEDMAGILVECTGQEWMKKVISGNKWRVLKSRFN
ncbi:MAG: hypothetical protein IPN36_07965 [Bacteroidetes bacterium]|nr:hypothetical protein [Bacteroidota bacterium]